MTVLPFPGGPVDVGSLVQDHPGGVTPTSRTAYDPERQANAWCDEFEAALLNTGLRREGALLELCGAIGLTLDDRPELAKDEDVVDAIKYAADQCRSRGLARLAHQFRELLTKEQGNGE
jgi:hypothetical protein